MPSLIRSILRNHLRLKPALEPAKAYDFWSVEYENQPNNLMMKLDEEIFCSFIHPIDLTNKKIADIGCGTGRHWATLYNKNPASLSGYDVSAGMLQQLKQKFPGAKSHLISDNLLTTIPDGSVDCLISTLTIAHIKNIEEAIGSWKRVLKPNGNIIITDFHPTMLIKGGKRSFQHDKQTYIVTNYIHTLSKIKKNFIEDGFTLINEVEIRLIEKFKPFYEIQNALHVYERFKGTPIIYGIHLNKSLATN